MNCSDKFRKLVHAPGEETRVGPEEVDGRPMCDHPGCGKKLLGTGECVDGHVQGASRAVVSGAEAVEALLCVATDIVAQYDDALYEDDAAAVQAIREQVSEHGADSAWQQAAVGTLRAVVARITDSATATVEMADLAADPRVQVGRALPLPAEFAGDNILTRGNVRVMWEDIGEGLSGDYDESDPDDVPLLRFYIDRWHPEYGADGWAEVEDGSFCTQMPTTATPAQKRRGLEILLAAVYDAVAAGEDVDRVTEELSWISPDDVDNAAARHCPACGRFVPADSPHICFAASPAPPVVPELVWCFLDAIVPGEGGIGGEVREVREVVELADEAVLLCSPDGEEAKLLLRHGTQVEVYTTSVAGEEVYSMFSDAATEATLTDHVLRSRDAGWQQHCPRCGQFIAAAGGHTCPDPVQLQDDAEAVVWLAPATWRIGGEDKTAGSAGEGEWEATLAEVLDNALHYDDDRANPEQGARLAEMVLRAVPEAQIPSGLRALMRGVIAARDARAGTAVSVGEQIAAGNELLDEIARGIAAGQVEADDPRVREASIILGQLANWDNWEHIPALQRGPTLLWDALDELAERGLIEDDTGELYEEVQEALGDESPASVLAVLENLVARNCIVNPEIAEPHYRDALGALADAYGIPHEQFETNPTQVEPLARRVVAMLNDVTGERRAAYAAQAVQQLREVLAASQGTA